MNLDFSQWRNEARELLIKGVAPENTMWSQNSSFDLLGSELRPVAKPQVPKEFFDLAEHVACVRDPDKWNLLYRLLYRLHHENPQLLKVSVDSDVYKAQTWTKSVHRDIHKMHAFVRFKQTFINGIETYVAWHQPEHSCLRLGAPFFMRRFGDKPWSIFTPDESAHWNMEELSFAKGMQLHDFDLHDPFDDVWKTYYKSIYNPARLKIKMMKSEMSPKYWASMPETEIIRDLIRDTPKRLQNMADTAKSVAQVPKNLNWHELKKEAAKCLACPIGPKATQTLFGEGNLQADLMIVGEQPGDEEDKTGKVFVGPAGRMLAEAFQQAGIDRDQIYITNAVKHFKWEPRGEMRLHKKPNGGEMHACKPWLESEIALVKPKVILALGTTAGMSLYGRLVKITEERTRSFHESGFAPTLLTSWHPAAILRSFSEEEKTQKYSELVLDLKKALQLSSI